MNSNRDEVEMGFMLNDGNAISGVRTSFIIGRRTALQCSVVLHICAPSQRVHANNFCEKTVPYVHWALLVADDEPI